MNAIVTALRSRVRADETIGRRRFQDDVSRHIIAEVDAALCPPDGFLAGGHAPEAIHARDLVIYLHGQLLGLTAKQIARYVPLSPRTLRVADRRCRVRVERDPRVRRQREAVEVRVWAALGATSRQSTKVG